MSTLYSTRSQSALFDAPFWLRLRQSQKKCSTAWEAASALFFRLPRLAQKCAVKNAHILTALSIDAKTLAQYIDHTNLRPDATAPEISKLCDEALEYKFRSVCVEKKWLGLVVQRLRGSGVMAITVVCFPHGTDSPEQKIEETRQARDAGAQEFDMVLNRNLLKTKDYAGLFKDIQAVVQTAKNYPVKVILETSELTEEEKILACGISKAAGALFVKTSTGFSKSGATESDVRLMRQMVGETMGVKASGGIRTLVDSLRMIQAGANRIGCSLSVAILKEIGEK